MKKIKIGLALSGGIDSTISNFLLKKNNFYLECFFMKNWKFFSNDFCSLEIDFFYAKHVANLLNSKLNVLDFSNEYWNNVFLSFLKQLSSGKTPNPDILCNKKIKFDIFIFYLFKNFNLDFLATGHYSSLIKKYNLVYIKQAFDIEKDQTYFLNQINKKINKKIIFPLSNYLKKDVRNVAFLNGLINFGKKDSTGICFIENNKFSKFINKYLGYLKGDIVYENKNILGIHEGLFFYTIGQKINFLIKELNIFYKLYVYKKDFKKNILFVSKFNYSGLFSKGCHLSNLNFFSYNSNFLFCYSRLRHGGSFVKSLVIKNNFNIYNIFFYKKQKALSVGQYISFYKDGFCLGGALIEKVF